MMSGQFETIKSILNKALVEPCTKNLASCMFWFGSLAILISSLFGNKIDSFQYIPTGTSEAILKAGSAILGAGVFAIIMKSAQFTNLFKKHIHDAFFDPTIFNNNDELSNRWSTITNAILKNVLPSSHKEASEQIMMQFFSPEIHYHFHDYETVYDIVVDEATNVATISNTLKTKLEISPIQKNPLLKQNFSSIDGSDAAIRTILIDGKELNDQILMLVDDPIDRNKKTLQIPLIDFINDGKSIEFERTVILTQDLKKEPFIMGTISRYIKGAKIRAKITPGYKLIFKKFGLGTSGDVASSKDGNGYTIWKLAEANSLLLPGQGYIIMVVHET
jgi:hypothetical protein